MRPNFNLVTRLIPLLRRRRRLVLDNYFFVITLVAAVAILKRVAEDAETAWEQRHTFFILFRGDMKLEVRDLPTIP